MPVARQYVQDNYKDSIGATPDLARFSAAMMFTPFVSVFSHPPDTIKTCLQGDVEQTTYKVYMQTTQVRRAATATTATTATAARTNGARGAGDEAQWPQVQSPFWTSWPCL